VYLNEIGEKVKRPAPSGSKALVWTINAEGISYITAYDAGNK
jgi:hypothetical protein